MENNLFINRLLAFIRRYEIIIVSVIVILSVILFSIIFLKSNFIQAAKINSDKKILTEKLAILKQKDNKLASLDSPLYQSVFTKMNQILPEEKDYFSLFSTFDNLERETGVVVISTEFQIGVISTSSARLTKAGAGIPAYTVPLSILVEGNADSIGHFISSLNKLTSRLIDVEEVRWSRNAFGNTQASIDGRAFFYPLPSTIGKIDNPLPKMENAQSELFQKIAEITPFESNISAGEMISKIEVGKKNPFQ